MTPPPTLKGTASAGSTVHIYDGETLLGSLVVGADGKWTFTIPVLSDDGVHNLTATALRGGENEARRQIGGYILNYDNSVRPHHYNGADAGRIREKISFLL
jgi:hypothetical protein